MDGVQIAFADREADQARMTIIRLADGSLIARRRRADDSIVPTHQTGLHQDLWRHTASGRLYIRHDDVLDVDRGEMCHDYSSFHDGRLWLRPVSEWEELSGGRPRFQRA